MHDYDITHLYPCVLNFLPCDQSGDCIQVYLHTVCYLLKGNMQKILLLQKGP
jgi:hypothetical protein